MALKVIKKGTFILREKAQFKPEFEHGIYCLRKDPCKPCLEKVMAAYHNMNSADQDEYLKLWNGYETEKYKQSLHIFLIETISMMFPSSEVELVVLVYELYDCNSGNIGEIAIKSSRFKHSCNENTIYYYDDDTKEYFVIAASKILCHEDIFVNAIASSGLLIMKNLGTRRKYLLKTFGFECHCDLCEIEELKGDNDRYKIYENLKIEIMNLKERLELMLFKNRYCNRGKRELYESAIRCYRDMYKCAKECSAGRLFIIVDILTPGYNCAIAAHSFASSIKDKVHSEFSAHKTQKILLHKSMAFGLT